jgi:hypothetical protein
LRKKLCINVSNDSDFERFMSLLSPHGAPFDIGGEGDPPPDRAVRVWVQIGFRANNIHVSHVRREPGEASVQIYTLPVPPSEPLHSKGMTQVVWSWADPQTDYGVCHALSWPTTGAD